MKEYEFHEYADIFPLMDKEDSDALKKSIQNKYLKQYPILLYEGKILDGRNRYRVCNDLNIDASFSEFKGDKQEAIDFVWSSNFDRRHLTPFQKLEALDLYQEQVKILNEIKQDQSNHLERKKNGTFKSENPVVGSEPTSGKNKKNNSKKKTRDQMAKKAKVSSKTVDTYNKAKRLQEEHPEIKKKFEDVKKGKIPINSLAKEMEKITAAEKREENLKQARLSQPEHQKIEYIPEVYNIEANRFIESLEEKSQDLLITDPPYMTDLEDIESFVNEWVLKALSKIKDSGRCYIFTGPYPKELQTYITILLRQKRFILSNILVWTYRNTIGPSTNEKYKNNWQACFYLYGKDAPPLNTDKLTEKFSVMDFNAPDGRQANNFFKWEGGPVICC